jgi:hypothetical protein
MIRQGALPFCGMLLSERVAQAVEHVTFNHGVAGSSPAALTNKINNLHQISELAREGKTGPAHAKHTRRIFPSAWAWILRPTRRKLRRR